MSTAGWSGCGPSWIRPGAPGEWDGQALLFTGDLASDADRGMAVPHPGLPDSDAPPVGPL